MALFLSHCGGELEIPTQDPAPDCTYEGGRDCSQGPPGSGVVVNPITLSVSLNFSAAATYSTGDPYFVEVYSGTSLVARTPYGIGFDSGKNGNSVLEAVDNMGQPTGLPMNFTAGSYTVYIGASTVGGTSDAVALKFTGYSITASTTLSYTFSDFSVAADEPVTITATGVSDGSKATCVWTEPNIYSSGAPPAFENLLVNGTAENSVSKSPYALGISLTGTNSFSGGTVTTDVHWGLLAGTYDLNCWVDVDGDQKLSAGDYTGFADNTTVSGGGTAITLNMKSYDPDAYETDDTAAAVTTASIATDGIFQTRTMHTSNTVDYIRVTAFPDSYGLYYDVQITDVQGGLTLSAEWRTKTDVLMGSTVTAAGANGDVFIGKTMLANDDYFVKVVETSGKTGSYKIRILPIVENVVIETTNTANGTSSDTTLTLYKSDGLTKFSRDTLSSYGCLDDAGGGNLNDGVDDNNGAGSFSLLDCNLPLGTYYVQVTGANKGAYAISARKPDVNATNCAASTSDPGDGTTPDANDTSQDDNSPLTARPLSLGCFYQKTANIHGSSAPFNSDWYKITIAPHPSLYIIETGDTANAASANPQITLFSSDGASKMTSCLDDYDTAPTVDFVTATQTVQEDTTVVNVQVKLSARTKQVVTIPYTVNAASTAFNSGSQIDHTLQDGSLTIQADQNFGTISFNVNNDSLAGEGDETVIINLGTPTNGVLGSVTTHTVTIHDNDNGCISGPTIDFASTVSLAQEDSNAASVTYSIPVVLTQCNNPGGDVTVDVTATGTATSGTDHNLPVTAQTLTFTMVGGTTGTVTQYVNFQILNDTDIDDNETIILTLSNPVNGSLGTTVHTVTIRDDDTASTFNDVNDGQDSGSAGSNYARLYCYLPAGTYYLKAKSEPVGNEKGDYFAAIRDPGATASPCTSTGNPGDGNSADSYEATELDAFSTAPTLGIGCGAHIDRNFDTLMSAPDYDIDWFKIVIP